MSKKYIQIYDELVWSCGKLILYNRQRYILMYGSKTLIGKHIADREADNVYFKYGLFQ